MLRDPLNLGLDGFRSLPDDAPVNFRQERPGARGAWRTIEIPVGAQALLLEGPAARRIRVLLDGEELPGDGRGRHALPPLGSGSARLELHALQGVLALTALWILP